MTPEPRPTPAETRPATAVPPFRTAVRAWFLVSLQTFGGPAGQIAVMQRELVDERRWIGQRRFLHAMNYCMLLPGPEAQQLATYVGWLLHGTRGGLVAGGLFVLPGVLALLALSVVYVAFGDTTAVAALFAGLAPAVVAIVVQAVQRVGRRALTSPPLVAIAVAAFLALALFAVPFPLVVLAAGLVGWVLGRRRPAAVAEPPADDGLAPVIADDALHSERPSGRRTLTVLAAGLLAWAVPLGAVVLLNGPGSTLSEQGLFFSGAAVVTFGGAYAVLAYVAQAAVGTYGWLAPGEMVRGLALAETTPGPLIMVVQFVAFVGAFRAPGGLDPWAAAVLASLLVTWVTFVPSFLFVLLGAPYIERLRGNRSLSAALTGITAAVVGVIASLGLYFAVHTLFSETVRLGPLALELPDPSAVRPVAWAVAAVAAVLLFRLRWSVLRTLGVCAVLGLAAGLAGLPVT
ncbi:chromate transporter [Geodermatophilus saharensis]|uniref:Chromate transporter n=1 Tax=Geodermatophilus saharensis TaxID=1137994 RepID=A0A239CKU2_9ACTN|nr:chromate efflux transporter [Geodermatophilus saharensis]SNS20777.1 chromate transporter [Geodermatophilus saharensis]